MRDKAANVSMHGGDSERERVRNCHACPILGLRAPVLLALDGRPSFLRHARFRSRASAFGAHAFGSFEVGAQEEKQEQACYRRADDDREVGPNGIVSFLFA